ncbi:kelch-like protein 3 [Oculina patagonica]
MDSLLIPISDTEEHPFCTEMMKRLNIQRRNEHFCDVILEVGSGDDQARLKAHRNVLCAASPFFFNALTSDMKEKKEGVIRLEDTSKDVMEKVLDYLYTGHVEITKENAFELFAQADYFLISSLKALSSKFILQTLDLSNCIVAYYFSIKYQWKELQDGAKEFILANFVAVAGTEDFLNLSSKEIEEWISSDTIIVKEEEEVFQVIVKWMENNQNSKDVDFLQLLHHVRCIYLSRNYVFNIILQHPLVKASTACIGFVLDAMEGATHGTDECFFSQAPRNCLKTHEDAIVACGRKRTLCYLPSENKWYELAEKLSNRNPYDQAITSLHGKLFIIGGPLRLSQNDTIAECFDPSHNQWAPTKPPEIVKCGTGAAVLQGFLYIVGGYNGLDNRISTVQKYNPDTNQWQDVSPLSCPRSNICVVADGSYLYAIGGSGSNGPFLDIVERFDPRNNTWRTLPSTLTKRACASGTAIRQKVFVFGGQWLSTSGVPCEVYDPATNVWSSFPTVIRPRCYASAVSFKGQIYVVGNFREDQREEDQMSGLQVYDIDKNEWKLCSDGLPGGFFKISTLRILRDVLAKCKVLS